jgi:uncharacterized protein YgbK (DUF1537 family)
VADDLTGAMDTGHTFAARGAETVVRFDDSTLDATVAVVDTDTRYNSADEAREAVREAVAGHDGVVYNKVDSTLRGNPAAEASAAVEASGADLAVVAPAFPATGRLTACGQHLVDGVPLDETPEGSDPETPVETADVGALFGGAGAPVASLSVERVARGPEAVRTGLADAVATHDVAPFVACDAVHDRHLDAIATGAAALDQSAVYVGSAGLAGHVPVAGTGPAPSDGSGRAGAESPGSAVLGVAGSTHPTTVEQVAALPGAAVVDLDAALAAHDPDAAAEGAAERAVGRIDDGGKAVLSSVGDGAESAALGAASDHGIDAVEARRNVAAALAGAAARICEARPPGGLFLTGGAVARATLSALSVGGLALRGEDISAGIPVADAIGGLVDGTTTITKAGAFGSRETLREALAFLG